MATAVNISHGHSAANRQETHTNSKTGSTKNNKVVAFVQDLIEDVCQKPLQPAAFAKHDMFREHILAMSISYFALIVLLILASLPVIACLVP